MSGRLIGLSLLAPILSKFVEAVPDRRHVILDDGELGFELAEPFLGAGL